MSNSSNSLYYQNYQMPSSRAAVDARAIPCRIVIDRGATILDSSRGRVIADHFHLVDIHSGGGKIVLESCRYSASECEYHRINPIILTDAAKREFASEDEAWEAGYAAGYNDAEEALT